MSPVDVDPASEIDYRPFRAAGSDHALREAPRERRYGLRGVFLVFGLNVMVALTMDLNGVRFPRNYWVQGLTIGVLAFPGYQARRYLARRMDRAELRDQHHQ